MEDKMTSAEKFCKIAEWLQGQDKEFTKNFKNSRAIYEVYNALPKGYDKGGQLTDYIVKNKSSWECISLAKRICELFGFRYFDFVPKHYTLHFGLNSYRNGDYEVCLRAHNNWVVDSKCNDMGCGITIKDKGNAKVAYEKLLKDHINYHGDDFEVSIGDKLNDAFKETSSKEEDMSIGMFV